ncbi:ImmA/IrrE family metallo-endopeptidase [Neobacillus sp. OS1-33]|uniref:ImmA/IrrE family metallo-endopeptidase n=1 Tax=Neobacillus sp. OS1-33 TaxID=3070683 RepID=UPI0027E0E6FC|nr:ImmA/IrrE family metallo-endopeptidase [Neobacillus sp. OS1-33]WML26258.1 ImmA/IrrE family metallo-endopeptidase [Neobacillus sp. OS1-33]
MNKLDSSDIFTITSLVKEKRNLLNVGMGPIGDNIFKLARKLNIKLVFLPIENTDNPTNGFSALYLESKEPTKNVAFVGLNTFQRYDRQIFAIAHEFYHHWTGTTLTVCHLEDEKSEITELKANRFAAEFLLPTETLLQEIGEKTGGKQNLSDITYLGVLRFIALLHCDYRLPYKAIIRRLFEINAISKTVYEKLCEENAREENGTYYKLGLSQNKEIFEKLNVSTMSTGVDGENFDMMINFLENDVITLEELANDLSLFEKELSDFELEEEVDDNSLEELDDILKDYIDDEAE